MLYCVHQWRLLIPLSVYMYFGWVNICAVTIIHSLNGLTCVVRLRVRDFASSHGLEVSPIQVPHITSHKLCFSHTAQQRLVVT